MKKKSTTHIIPLMLLLIGLWFTLSACASVGKMTIMDPSFKPSGNSIALLPIGSSSGIEVSLRRKLGATIYEKLSAKMEANWVAPDAVGSKLQTGDTLSKYEKFVDGFQKTGVANKENLSAVSKALGVKYLVMCSIKHNVTGGYSMTNYRYASATLQVFRASDAKIVAEVVGEENCGSGLYDHGEEGLINVAVDQAIAAFGE